MLNRLEMLRLFCAAADAASFKEAALRLGASPQAITRAVQELEAQVGEVLFHRNTRGNQITEFGEQLAREARAGLSRIDSLFQRPSAQAQDGMAGVLRITAPISLGRMFIAPLLRDIGRRHPAIRFDLRLSDQIADVVDEKIDIGVRLGFLRDSRYVAKPVTKLNFFIVGAPELIARCGAPASLEQLATLPVTALIDRGTGRPWSWQLAQGGLWTPPQPAFGTNDLEAECDAVLAGLGFGHLVSYVAIPHLRSGKLVAVLPELSPDPWDLYVYRPQRGPVPARVRLVFDQLVALFSDPARFPVQVPETTTDRARTKAAVSGKRPPPSSPASPAARARRRTTR